MTVGLCMDIVEKGLAMHLRYIRKTMHPYRQTELQPEPLRGGSAPITDCTHGVVQQCIEDLPSLGQR